MGRLREEWVDGKGYRKRDPVTGEEFFSFKRNAKYAPKTLKTMKRGTTLSAMTNAKEVTAGKNLPKFNPADRQHRLDSVEVITKDGYTKTLNGYQATRDDNSVSVNIKGQMFKFNTKYPSSVLKNYEDIRDRVSEIAAVCYLDAVASKKAKDVNFTKVPKEKIEKALEVEAKVERINKIFNKSHEVVNGGDYLNDRILKGDVDVRTVNGHQGLISGKAVQVGKKIYVNNNGEKLVFRVEGSPKIAKRVVDKINTRGIDAALGDLRFNYKELNPTTFAPIKVEAPSHLVLPEDKPKEPKPVRVESPGQTSLSIPVDDAKPKERKSNLGSVKVGNKYLKPKTGTIEGTDLVYNTGKDKITVDLSNLDKETVARLNSSIEANSLTNDDVAQLMQRTGNYKITRKHSKVQQTLKVGKNKFELDEPTEVPGGVGINTGKEVIYLKSDSPNLIKEATDYYKANASTKGRDNTIKAIEKLGLTVEKPKVYKPKNFVRTSLESLTKGSIGDYYLNGDALNVSFPLSKKELEDGKTGTNVYTYDLSKLKGKTKEQFIKEYNNIIKVEGRGGAVAFLAKTFKDKDSYTKSLIED